MTRWHRRTSAAPRSASPILVVCATSCSTSRPAPKATASSRYAEANNVLPFVNNLWTTTLTGAQFKTLLEQQWQRDANGNVPTRPYLQLGLSDNVTYTYDDTLPEGSRITSITINGAPYDPAAQYRIGTFSFLATGGDNFRIFTSGHRHEGLGSRRSRRMDRLPHRSPAVRRPTSPSRASRSATCHRSPPSVAICSSLWPQLDLTSLGSPANTSVALSIGGVPLGVGSGHQWCRDGRPAGARRPRLCGTQTADRVASPSDTTLHVSQSPCAACCIGEPAGPTARHARRPAPDGSSS